MDRFKKMANDVMSSGLGKHLQGIDFPCSKDELLSQLEQKGVPSQVVDKVRDTDTSQFDSVDDAKKKVGL